MYIDTSALVKLYVREPDSEACEATVAGASLASSRLLYCEFRSALLVKVSRGALSAEVMAETLRAFETDIVAHRIQFIPLSDLLVKDAADLILDLHPTVPLRTLDALHLATYLSAHTGPLFTKDLRMLHAAERLGLPLAG